MFSEVNRRNNGIYYTPENLAYFTVMQVISSKNATVFDPSFGKGALLDASYNILKNNFKATNASKNLYGCDIEPYNLDEIPVSVREANLVRSNFFNLPSILKRKYNVIVINPPYVRHHRMDKNLYSNTVKRISGTFGLEKRADLWTYFLVESFNLLKKGGNLAAILPWSFLFTDYSKKIRQLVLSNFNSVKGIVIGKRLFKHAKERIIVLIAKGYGRKANNIKISYIQEVPTEEVDNCRTLSKKEWIENPFIFIKDSKINQLLEVISEKEGWKPLSFYSKINIGVVTGANKYFVLTPHSIKEKKLPKKYFQAIVTSSKQLRTYEIKESECKKYLLSLNSKPIKNISLVEYIKKMEKVSIHKRAHSKNRDPWYSVKINPTSDAFLPCMSADIPCLVFNLDSVQCTNTVHKVFFNPELTRLQKRWIRLSFLSSVSQLSVETNCRTYGSGVLKLEPSEAGRVLVHDGNGKNIPKLLDAKIKSFLTHGEREKAIKLATKCCVDILGLDNNLADEAMELRKILRQQRISK